MAGPNQATKDKVRNVLTTRLNANQSRLGAGARKSTRRSAASSNRLTKGKRKSERAATQRAASGGHAPDEGGGLLGIDLGWDDLLTALDFPGRVVRTGLVGAGELLSGDLSFNDAGEQLSGEAHMGDLLKDAGIGGVAGGILGFIGDVATDPLPYTPPAAKLAGGAQSVSRRIATEGVERVATELAEKGAKGLLSEAAWKSASAAERSTHRATMGRVLAQAEKEAAPLIGKVGQRGASALNKEELARFLNVKGGAKIRVPGTGRVAKRLGLTKRDVPVEFGLLGKGVTDKITAPLSGLRQATRESKAGAAVLDKFGGERAFKDMFQSGDPEKAAAGLTALTEGATARAATRASSDERLGEDVNKVRGV